MKGRFSVVVMAVAAAGVLGAAGSTRGASVTVGSVSPVGSASALGVVKITNNAPSVSIGVTYPDATYLSTPGVLFVLTLAGTAPSGSFIDDVYVQNLQPWLVDGTPQVYPIEDSNTSTTAGIIWEYSASPQQPPGGNGKFLADVSLNSASHNGAGGSYGINPGESLGLFFAYEPNVTFTQVDAAINAYLLTDAAGLALAMHVQGLPNGTSDSYVTYGLNNPPPPPVPLPMSAWTGLTLLAGIGMWERIRRR